jgi:ankyrin repeat protein
VYCQLVNICGCIPARIRHALAGLPETLDGTYERTLREINKEDWEFAHRLLQIVTVAARPLHVEELAELLAFDFNAGSIPKFHEGWRLEDPIHAVLSTCHSFLAIINAPYSRRKVVQFSHFSVREFLTSARLAGSNDTILRRYHISETPAHAVAARACLGYLLHLDKDVTSHSLRKLPFSKYSATYWVYHTRVEDVSQNVKDGLKELFDPSKPHLAVCIWICDPFLSSWEPRQQSERPLPLRRNPLHYATFWDLHSIVELLVNEFSQDVNSRDFTNSATPLHLASEQVRLEIARKLIEYGASVSAQNKDGETPLHLASQPGRLEVARLLIERGADVSAQNKDGRTPLHLMCLGNWVQESSYPEVARMLIERGADVSAQDKDGQHPLHLALQARRPEVARMLIERGVGVSAQNKDGQTPLHLVLQAERLEVALMLIERGADVSAQNKDGQTPLHLVSLRNRTPYFDSRESSHPEVARMLIERGADVSAQDKDGQTPVHMALQAGRLEVARMLIVCGASVSARNKDGQTPRNWVPYLESSRQEVARIFIGRERGADVSARDSIF